MGFLLPRVPDRVNEGPRLESLAVMDSAYGRAIPILYGHHRLPGNVIWATEMREERIETSEQVGGKGGGGGTITTVTYLYYGNFAVAFCEGQVGTFLRIWADGILLIDLREETKVPVDYQFRLYDGSEEQMPDPLIEEHTEERTPAYRGLAYIVFEDLPLADFGNRLPAITVEIRGIGGGGGERVRQVADPDDPIGDTAHVQPFWNRGVIAVASALGSDIGTRLARSDTLESAGKVAGEASGLVAPNRFGMLGRSQHNLYQWTFQDTTGWVNAQLRLGASSAGSTVGRLESAGFDVSYSLNYGYVGLIAGGSQALSMRIGGSMIASAPRVGALPVYKNLNTNFLSSNYGYNVWTHIPFIGPMHIFRNASPPASPFMFSGVVPVENDGWGGYVQPMSWSMGPITGQGSGVGTGFSIGPSEVVAGGSAFDMPGEGNVQADNLGNISLLPIYDPRTNSILCTLGVDGASYAVSVGLSGNPRVMWATEYDSDVVVGTSLAANAGASMPYCFSRPGNNWVLPISNTWYQFDVRSGDLKKVEAGSFSVSPNTGMWTAARERSITEQRHHTRCSLTQRKRRMASASASFWRTWRDVLASQPLTSETSTERSTAIRCRSRQPRSR